MDVYNNKKKLDNILQYSYANIRFYKQAFGDNPYRFPKLTNFPIIDKNTISQDYFSFIDNQFSSINELMLFPDDISFKKDYHYVINGCNVYVEYTSGSTGVPFSVIKTTQERLKLATMLWKRRNKITEVNPRSMFNFIHNRDGLYPFPFDEVQDDSYRMIKEINYLQKCNYLWWHIYPGQLHAYDIFNESDFNFSKLEVIECNGSYISDEEKNHFTRRFDCRIINNYGCREVWNIAYDCPSGYLHINEDAVLFELVDENNLVIDNSNTEGYIVITSLILYSMPFIRYKIGDIAYYMDGVCPCGNSSTRIQLLPQRHHIYGVGIYGNTFFKKIINQLRDECGVSNFESINVIQRSETIFEVNIKNNKVDRNIIEENFERLVVNDKEWILKYCMFTFTYNNDIIEKSIFRVYDWR